MAITDDPESDGVIHVESLVSSSTREGVVVFKWGDRRGQLTPDEARAHALVILEVAEAAEADAFMVNFLREKCGAKETEALGTLIAFRAFRKLRAKENQS